MPETGPPGGARDGERSGLRPRRWYFCVNARGFDRSMPLMAVALASARANTRLRPTCIYNGDNRRHVARLEAAGAEVLRHRSTFEDDLRAGYGDRFDAFSGHWLRVDLPLIEREEEVVLYTDVDVMFLRHPAIPERPRTLAAAPEFDRANLSYFSSGVMILNLPRLRALHAPFVAAIRRRLRGDFRWPAHDQESFNRFFGPTPLNRLRGRAFTPMDPGLNWKPFWGFNPQASIVHFHGPKPRHVRQAEAGGVVADPLRRLWSQAPKAYAHYAGLWDGFDQGLRAPDRATA